MFQRNSTMREAFDSIKIRNIKRVKKNTLLDHVVSSLNRKVGLVRENEWNAHLSMKTAQALNAKGGWDFKHLPFTRYDGMLQGE